MNWRTPKLGDKRTRVIFAVLPHDCDDGLTRWLERIQVDEVYSEEWNRTWCFWRVVSARGLTVTV